MSAYAYSTLLNGLNPQAPVASGTALASSVTETIITPSTTTFPDFTFGLHAPALKQGDVVRVTAAGIYSTTGTPTLQLRLRYGGLAGTLLLDTGAVTAQGTVTNTSWRLQAEFEVRSAGSAGLVLPMGMTLGIAGAATWAQLPATGATTVAVDTTTNKALVVTGQWGTNSPSNSVQVLRWLIESLN